MASSTKIAPTSSLRWRAERAAWQHCIAASLAGLVEGADRLDVVPDDAPVQDMQEAWQRIEQALRLSASSLAALRA
jgi:hypothetical protein